jgi:hypothetical protein
MKVKLGKEEEIRSSDSFITNLFFGWLKTKIILTNKRVVAAKPNTLLKAIPFGMDEVSHHIKNIASVRVSTKFHFIRFLCAVVLILLSIQLMTQTFAGFFVWMIGFYFLLNSYTSTLVITNNGSGKYVVELSILEKNKIKELVNEVNDVITDVA